MTKIDLYKIKDAINKAVGEYKVDIADNGKGSLLEFLENQILAGYAAGTAGEIHYKAAIERAWTDFLEASFIRAVAGDNSNREQYYIDARKEFIAAVSFLATTTETQSNRLALLTEGLEKKIAQNVAAVLGEGR